MKDKNIKKGFNQIEFCNYTDEIGHELKNNKGYVDIKNVFMELLSTLRILNQKDVPIHNKEVEEHCKYLIDRAEELV